MKCLGSPWALTRIVGRGIPVAHRERVLDVVPAGPKPVDQPAALERAPGDDRGAAPDLPVVLLDLLGAAVGDHPPDDRLADRAARKADDLPVLEEAQKEGTDRLEAVGSAEVQEEDPGLQTVREKM